MYGQSNRIKNISKDLTYFDICFFYFLNSLEQEPHRSALYYWYRWLLYSFSSDTDSRYQITSMYIFIQRNTYFSFVHIIWSLQTCVKICSCRNFYQLIGFLPGNVINHDCLSSYRYVDNWPIPAPGASKHKESTIHYSCWIHVPVIHFHHFSSSTPPMC